MVAYISRAHVKVAWDETVGKSWTQKNRDSDENGHWSMAIWLYRVATGEWGDGTRSVIIG